ncbi:50S ribosomal protein-like protein L4 [Phaeosphaeria sp. MPI-PUGE-AT-0046c]|nr:50S ribosomal protein-like protein L4 [Phaeosphaeria sp. MPI-PUGE-AT-0046c]
MASSRISAPMRGVTNQLSRLSIRRDALTKRCTKCLSTPTARSITTTASSRASLSSITTSATKYVPIKPFEEQTVLATIHQFPSLEPLRFETYPATHLYLPTRRDILHRAVIFEADHTRLGTASTKTRYEVRGSARKIRPQKGSGRARLGDKNSPMLKGGGVAFGPKPRDFSTKLPKKVYDLAWRTALSYRFRKNELIIVDNAMEIESPSSFLMEDIFAYQEKLLRGRGRNLLVTHDTRPLLKEVLKEIGREEQTLTWEEVDVKDLLSTSRIIIERAALENIFTSHQEDLAQPWHPSFRAGSAPSELKPILGWKEFKTLQLLESKARQPRRQDSEEPYYTDVLTTARPAKYEEVADKRYTYALTLPEGSAQRTSLLVSAYTLLAEAKSLYFANTTGLAWSDYSDLPADVEDPSLSFPKRQVLDHQAARELSRTDDDNPLSLTRLEAEVKANVLMVEATEVKLEAALLAAQVHEHESEAHCLRGDEESAEVSFELASRERTVVEEAQLDVLERKIEAARADVSLQKVRNDYAARVKAQEVLEALEAELKNLNNEMLARQEGEEVDGEVVEGTPMPAESPVIEEIKQEKK